MKDNQTKYDIIGDIHGHATALESLLRDLGYREVGNTFRHPEGRRAVFVGDYLDRGPEIRRTLDIVRNLIDSGNGFGILGNHEVNALRYHTRGSSGQPLRENHGTKKTQHEATLRQFAKPDPIGWLETLEWLAGLPLWLDLGGIRIVHAAWSEDAIRGLAGAGPLKGINLERLSRKDSIKAKWIDRLINGNEARLPEGEFFETPDGRKRTEIRTRWWEPVDGRNLGEIAFPGGTVGSSSPVGEDFIPEPYDADAPPVFFGHYAVRNADPAPLRHNVATVDYGMGKGGPLVAYRWEGESELRTDHFTTHTSIGATTTVFLRGHDRMNTLSGTASNTLSPSDSRKKTPSSRS